MPLEVLLIYSIVNIDKIMNTYSPQGDKKEKVKTRLLMDFRN